VWLGFGLEAAVAKTADAKLERERSAATTPEEVQKFEIRRGMEIGQYTVRRTSWMRLAILCHLLALASIGAEIWLARRADRPLPKAVVEW
jgi:hypothetical protein